MIGRTKETRVLVFVVGKRYVLINIVVWKISHSRSKRTRETECNTKASTRFLFLTTGAHGIGGICPSLTAKPFFAAVRGSTVVDIRFRSNKIVLVLTCMRADVLRRA